MCIFRTSEALAQLKPKKKQTKKEKLKEEKKKETLIKMTLSLSYLVKSKQNKCQQQNVVNYLVSYSCEKVRVLSTQQHIRVKTTALPVCEVKPENNKR